MNWAVSINGDGLSAAACHLLLRQFGWSTSGMPSDLNPDSSGIPFLVIDPVSWQIIADIFGTYPERGFETTRRLVAHYHSDELFVSNESRCVVSAGGLRKLFPVGAGSAEPGDESAILETRAGQGGGWISSGHRASWICHAVADSLEAARTLIFEFVPEGWVFWAPTGPRTGFLQFVLPRLDFAAEACRELWRSTRILRKWISPCEPWQVRGVPSGARFKSRLREDPTIFCGSGAICFDPIAGEGTGASLRSSILACAAIRLAAECPSLSDAVWRHYQTRQARAFCDHLAICREQYRFATLSPSWEAEIAMLDEAYTKAEACIHEAVHPQFRLHNFSLCRFSI